MIKTTAMIAHKTATKSILDLCNLYRGGNLNLKPGFQRQSVWKEPDRKKLIDSILRNYPLPAIFFYRRIDQGKLVFDVIDGKQRLESILMFTGLMRGRFWIRSQIPGTEDIDWIDWKTLQKKGLANSINGYEIPVIEVDGQFGDIVDVFVRINSTGKPLTSQEKRSAKYYNTPFLQSASRLAKQYEPYFLASGILSPAQITRMKHIELISELMLSLIQKDVLNKKTALDHVMASTSFDGRQLAKALQLTKSTLNRMKRMFPKIGGTRLAKLTDFYSLAVLIGKFDQEGLILTDKKRNVSAWELLKAFSNGVDEVRELQRKAQGAKPDQELYRDYLLTVSQMTDDVSQRRKREEILRGILQSVFEKKDSQRGFSTEQRRIIWNTANAPVCTHNGCRKVLTWENFTIDHIKAHSIGGRSNRRNAQLMCREHNSSKGNRKARQLA
jgi:hypothetical protein